MEPLCSWCDSEPGRWFWPTPSFEYEKSLGWTRTSRPLILPPGWYGCRLCARLYKQGIHEALVRHLLELRLSQDPRLMAHGLELEREVDRWALAVDRQLRGLSVELRTGRLVD